MAAARQHNRRIRQRCRPPRRASNPLAHHSTRSVVVVDRDRLLVRLGDVQSHQQVSADAPGDCRRPCLPESIDRPGDQVALATLQHLLLVIPSAHQCDVGSERFSKARVFIHEPVKIVRPPPELLAQPLCGSARVPASIARIKRVADLQDRSALVFRLLHMFAD